MVNTPRSLLERLRDKPDATSWQRLVDLYTPFLRRVIGVHGISDADTDDLIQDVFDVLTVEIERFEHSGRTGAFRKWLRTILNHRIHRFWRDQQRNVLKSPSSVDLNLLENPSNELNRLWDEEHNRWIANRLLEMLEAEFTATTWLAFRRQVVDGKSSRETAEELGISVNAVLIAKSRVLRRMRREADGLIDKKVSQKNEKC